MCAAGGFFHANMLQSVADCAIININMDKAELLRKIFAHDKFVQLAGIELEEVNDDGATVTAAIGPQHLNANGSVQGGMLFSVADFAFAVLSNYLHPVTVTQVANFTYVKAAYTDKLRCEAREIVRSGHNTVAELKVFDGAGNLVCAGTFNGFVKDTPIEELIARFGG